MTRAARAGFAAIACAVSALAVVAGASAASVRGSAFAVVNAGVIPVSVRATPLVPREGTVLTGVSAGDAGAFAAQIGKHPAVFGQFVTWGQSIHWAFNDAAAAHARLMLHISTTMGYGAPQTITPAAIARGDGDGYLMTLAALIASRGKPVYIRLFPEMNQANNAYCGFNPDGSSRGPSYAPSAFIAAWRRVVIVLRGGAVASIDAQLAALGQPRLHGTAVGATVPTSRVSFVWTPQVAGSPDIPANSPAAYYPGDRYVDWVGTDFYSKFPNFTGLDAFYRQYPQKPFAFGEWAIWGGDSPTFVGALFRWVAANPRVRMMLYNQGYGAASPFALSADPASRAAIRQQLSAPRFLAFTSDW